MGLKGKVQQKIGQMFQQGTSNARQQQFYNFYEAESVAIVFNHESEQQYRFVRDYLKKIKEDFNVKTTMAFAFVDERTPPSYIQSKLEFDYFTRKDVNWQQKPAGSTVDNFMNEAYNILIDFTSGDIPAIQHIVANSQANCKVGMHYGLVADRYDLVIQMPKKTWDIKKFIEQLNHYLTIINRKEAVTV